MRILLIQYKMLGDVLTSTIIADQIKKSHPQALVDYLITTPAAALVQGHPAIAAMIPVTKQEMETVGGIISLSRKLTKNKYDVIIDVYGKNNSALLTFLTRSTKKIGYKKWFAAFVYTASVKNKPDFTIDFQGTSLWSRLILTTLLDMQPDWTLQPKIYLTDSELASGLSWILQSGLSLEKPITMAGVLGSEDLKSLPARTMAQLLDYMVIETGSQILFNYMPSQKEEAMAIYDLCATTTREHIFIDHYPSGIRDFLKVLAHCTAFVGNEGGGVNMAKALDVPTFSIYSPWIVKGAWNAGADGAKHIAVHLQDFYPELFTTTQYKDLKSQTPALYKKFTTDLINKKLRVFIKENY